MKVRYLKRIGDDYPPLDYIHGESYRIWEETDSYYRIQIPVRSDGGVKAHVYKGDMRDNWEVITEKEAKLPRGDYGQTDLQRLNSKAQHDINFKLHMFYASYDKDELYSVRTRKMIVKYNAAVRVLQLAIKRDYEVARTKILARRQKEKKEGW
jgi:hypothetical protein